MIAVAQKNTPLEESALETLQRHRRAWSEKPLLRRVYQCYFEAILARCGALRPIVELGSGAGFFKRYFPELLATDYEATPWTDRVVDACDMPFGDGSIGHLVMIDVFHHLPRPARFLEEAARVLKPGGRVVMLEPWAGLLGNLFYRYIHAEGAEWNVDPHAPFAQSKKLFDGNAALPRMYFDRTVKGPAQTDSFAALRLMEIRPIPAITWLATGGFQPYRPLPAMLFPLAMMLEWLTAPFARWIGLRVLITLEQRPVAGPPDRH